MRKAVHHLRRLAIKRAFPTCGLRWNSNLWLEPASTLSNPRPSHPESAILMRCAQLFTGSRKAATRPCS